MRIVTFIIVAWLGYIGWAIFAGHQTPSSSAATASTAGPAHSSMESRMSSYTSPLEPPVRVPVYPPKPHDGASNPAPGGATVSAVSSSPSFVSNVVNFLRMHVPFFFSHRTSWTLDDLRIARGQVADIHDGKVFVNCQPWHVVQRGDWRVHAGDGFSSSPVLGMADSADEMARFGTLKAFVRGSFVSSPYNPRIWNPDRYLNGQIVMEGCPGRTGQNIKIVVAPVGMIEWQRQNVPVYTAAFQLDDAVTAPGAWMWQGSGNGPLERIPDRAR